jgi:hypothetical protein
MSDESKPSILLSLPPELWHHIMKAARDHVVDEAKYKTLPNAALAHRILRPYAQEELLRDLYLKSKEKLIALVKALKGSSQLAEYAKRTEVVSIDSMMDEGEGLNELLATLFEMCCNTKSLCLQYMPLRLSTIGKSPSSNSTSTQDADLEIFSARLSSLRWLNMYDSTIHINGPTPTFARLNQLEFHDTYLVDGNRNDCDLDLARSLFSPAQFPALRVISLDDVALEDDHTRFNLLLPQLSDVKLMFIPLSLVATQLPHCTSLKTLRLRIGSDDQDTDLLPFFNSLRDVNLGEFRYFDWTGGDLVSLQVARDIMAIVGEMKTLKRLSLGISKINTNTVTKKKWIEFKEGVRKLCEKNKVEIIRVFDEVYDADYGAHIDELIWVD